MFFGKNRSSGGVEWLLVCLGNPGDPYENTRHNVGFDVLDALARKLGVSIAREKENALVGECFIDGKKVVLALPQTYMNLSGEAVARLVNWYKIAPEHLMVAYDDIDLAPGSIRIRKSGSAGTHNGMRSIVGLLGYDTFPRLRVGVGERKPGFELADWVLSRYQQPQEQQAADAAYALAADAIVEYIQNGIESAMCKYNTKKKKPAPSEGAAQ